MAADVGEAWMTEVGQPTSGGVGRTYGGSKELATVDFLWNYAGCLGTPLQFVFTCTDCEEEEEEETYTEPEKTRQLGVIIGCCVLFAIGFASGFRI